MDAVFHPIDVSHRIDFTAAQSVPEMQISDVQGNTTPHTPAFDSTYGEMVLPDSLLYQENGKPLPASLDSEQMDESTLWSETVDGPTTTFKCKSCHYASTYKSRIKQHMRSVHSTLKPYKCDHCDHTTAIRASLTKHVNAVHRKLKPFSCSLCSYTCNLKRSLEVHLTGYHQRQYKYTCPHCQYAAAAKNVVDIHIQAVHNKERPYKCPHCDYKSAYPQYIPKHIAAVHDRQKPYACPHCPYRSSYKTYLQKHCDAVHKNIKPFSCPHCSYITSYSQYLNKHISAVHNDEKPHKCPLCSFRCAYKQYINKHIELVHSGNQLPGAVGGQTSDEQRKMADVEIKGESLIPGNTTSNNINPRNMLPNNNNGTTFSTAINSDTVRNNSYNYLTSFPAIESREFPPGTSALVHDATSDTLSVVLPPSNRMPTAAASMFTVDSKDSALGVDSVPKTNNTLGSLWPDMT